MVGMSRPRVHLLVSALGWVGFVGVTGWTILFLAGIGVTPTVDGPIRTGTVTAVAVDLALLLLFAVQHSLMARRPVKAWLGHWVPPELERTTYVLATVACLVLQLALWQPWGGWVWHVGGPAAVVLWLFFGLGWVLAVVATFAIDQLELVGLRQAGWGGSRTTGSGELEVTGLYAVVRHPLMTGLLVAFWATPRMSAGHLLFALAATGYVVVGVWFEERDLRRTFGTAYDDYAAAVPALVPGLRLSLPSHQSLW
jgi:protein-S-isoprenylcysteine O-methyltransferase Ste14